MAKLKPDQRRKTTVAGEKFTEDFIQRRLTLHFKKEKYLVGNIYLFDWESDFLIKRRSGLWAEFEIKVTFADFHNDAKHKQRKFEILESGGYDHVRGWKNVNGEKTELRERREMPRPNYFYYCVPFFLADKVEPELPDYAGLLVVNEYGVVTERRKAKMLHKEHLDNNSLGLTDKFYYRWKHELDTENRIRKENDTLRKKVTLLEKENSTLRNMKILNEGENSIVILPTGEDKGETRGGG